MGLNVNQFKADLETLADLLESAQAVAQALQALRDGTTTAEWDQLETNLLVEDLLNSCADLEDNLASD